MRLAIICPYDMEIPGGVQSQVNGLAGALQNLGVSVVVVSPSATGKAAAAACYEFVSVGKSMSVSANGSQAPVAPGPTAMRRTFAALRQARPDVVHIHEPLTPGSSLAALLGRQRPIVATFHRAGTDALYRAEGKLLRPLSRRIAAPIAVSEAARTTAVEVLGHRLASMAIIPNGVLVTPQTGGRDDKDLLGEDPTGPVTVAFVGRHEERKGLAVLLAAYAVLTARIERPVKLKVVGDGPDSAALRRRYSDLTDIEWLGAVDDRQREEVLRNSDLFVAPSIRGESFGVVLLEAMAAGTAVVASDLEGYKLAGGDAPAYFRAGDSEGLAAQLESLIGDPARRAALRLRGLQRAREFSLDAIAGRYLEIYNSLRP